MKAGIASVGAVQTLTWIAVLFWILAALMVVLAVIGPRRLYWRFDAKFQRHPEANEPSDAGYAVRQGSTVVAAVILVVAAIGFTAWRGDAKYESASDLYLVASSAGNELSSSGSTYSFGPFFSEVERAVFDAGDEGQLEVVESGENESGADQYEIRTRDGRFAVCLSVSIDRDILEPEAPRTVSTTVDERACR